MSIPFRLTLLATPLILAACGGGGGGGGTTSLYDGPTAAITIDETSADDTASKAVQETLSSDLGDMGGDFIPAFAKSETDSNQSALQAASGVALDMVNIALGKAGSSTSSIPSIADSEDISEFLCLSGKAVATYDVASQETFPSSGDYMKYTFTDCDMGDGVYNGSIKMVFNSVDTSIIDVTETFNQFETTASGSTLTLHGDMRLAMDMSASPYQFTISGSSFAIESVVGDAIAQILMTNYSLDETYNTSTGAATGDYNYKISSTEIDGSFTVETTTPFVVASGNTYPSAGVMVITGASGASIRLTAENDATNVTIDEDFDGDGAYAFYKSVTWCTLDPQPVCLP